jgi:hypothetical protein
MLGIGGSIAGEWKAGETYNTWDFFRIRVRVSRKNLNFPYANMKWFVWQCEIIMIPPFHLEWNIEMKYWCHDSVGKLSLHFVDSTLSCPRVPLFSLLGLQKKNLMTQILSSVFFYLHRLIHLFVGGWFLCLHLRIFQLFCKYRRRV